MRRTPARFRAHPAWAAWLILLVASACSSKPAPSHPDATTAVDTVPSADALATEASGTSADSVGDAPAGDPYGNPDCDPIHPVRCGYPWPSSLYLQPDATRKTGYRLQFGKTTLPQDSAGKAIDPAPYARLDGFSIGTSLLMLWPDLDPANLADEGHIEKSVLADASIVWLEVDGKGQILRHIPYFTELDAQEPDPLKKTLYVRPGVILKPATRYVVGVRGLKAMNGTAFLPSPAFVALRDRKTAGTSLAGRQARFDDVMVALQSQGVQNSDLQLAWDFVTASDDAEHAAILKMRTDAFAATGPLGPELTVTEVQTFTPEQDADIAMEVTGTLHVPSFLHKVTVASGAQIELLDRDAAGLPKQTGWEDREFYVRVPRKTGENGQFGLLQYGHGLNGNARECETGYLGKIANQDGLIVYAAHMRGMSQFDAASIVALLFDIDQFPTLTDKLHQGMIEWLLLQRAMRERFSTLDVAVQHKLEVDKGRMHYFGNSQGGIYGGTVVALSQDVTRGDLGVPGSNYSLLLQRSTDFEGFFEIIRGVYPDTRDQAVLLLTLQLLWDAVDPVTHYRHLNQQPYPDTPSHDVLMDPAQGDFQVSVMTNEIVARSGVGIALMKGWGKDVALVTPHDFPHKGSGMVLYDFGNPWPPFGNVPPKPEDQGPCAKSSDCKEHFTCKHLTADEKSPTHCMREDPHELPRRSPQHTQQMLHFFHTGEIIDTCGGDGCHPD